jgi:NitT/TauT family transport system substrate-binding protein
MSNGFFKDEGLTVDLTNGNGSDKAMTTLLADQADIVLAGAEAGIYVTSRSTRKSIIAFAKLTQTDGSFLVSREPLSHFTWGDLKGKILLGQRRGGMPEMVSEYVQRKNGVIPHQDVKILQNVDFKNLGNAFLSGTGDFVQLFEPTASHIEQQKKGTVIASFGRDSGLLPYTCYMTTKTFMDKHPNVVKRFTRAIVKGQQWIESHSAKEIAQVVKAYFPETSDEIIMRVIKRYKDQGSYAKEPLINEKEYTHLLNIMKQAGELPKNVRYEELVKGVPL